MTCRERRASNKRPVLSDDPVMCGPAAWRNFSYFHQPVQCFGGSRFDAISGAIPRNDDLAGLVPACAARQLDREHRLTRLSAPGRVRVRDPGGDCRHSLKRWRLGGPLAASSSLRHMFPDYRTPTRLDQPYRSRNNELGISGWNSVRGYLARPLDCCCCVGAFLSQSLRLVNRARHVSRGTRLPSGQDVFRHGGLLWRLHPRATLSRSCSAYVSKITNILANIENEPRSPNRRLGNRTKTRQILGNLVRELSLPQEVSWVEHAGGNRETGRRQIPRHCG